MEVGTKTGLWLTLLALGVAFCIVLTVLQPSDAEICTLGRGEWDERLGCFYYDD